MLNAFLQRLVLDFVEWEVGRMRIETCKDVLKLFHDSRRAWMDCIVVWRL